MNRLRCRTPLSHSAAAAPALWPWYVIGLIFVLIAAPRTITTTPTVEASPAAATPLSSSQPCTIFIDNLRGTDLTRNASNLATPFFSLNGASDYLFNNLTAQPWTPRSPSVLDICIVAYDVATDVTNPLYININSTSSPDGPGFEVNDCSWVSINLQFWSISINSSSLVRTTSPPSYNVSLDELDIAALFATKFFVLTECDHYGVTFGTVSFTKIHFTGGPSHDIVGFADIRNLNFICNRCTWSNFTSWSMNIINEYGVLGYAGPNVTFSHCLVQDNTNMHLAEIISCYRVILDHVAFVRNAAVGTTGPLLLVNANALAMQSVSFVNNSVRSNALFSAAAFGSNLNEHESTLPFRLVDSVFEGNTVQNASLVGLDFVVGSISNCTFANNTLQGSQSAGLVLNDATGMTGGRMANLTNCTFRGNHADGPLFGSFEANSDYDYTLLLDNNVFVENVNYGSVGTINCQRSYTTLTRNEFIRNLQTQTSSFLFLRSSATGPDSPTPVPIVFQDNVFDCNARQVFVSNSSSTLIYQPPLFYNPLYPTQVQGNGGIYLNAGPGESCPFSCPAATGIPPNSNSTLVIPIFSCSACSNTTSNNGSSTVCSSNVPVQPQTSGESCSFWERSDSRDLKCKPFSIAAIVIIAVGAAVALTATIMLICCCCCLRRQKQQQPSAKKSSSSSLLQPESRVNYQAV